MAPPCIISFGTIYRWQPVRLGAEIAISTRNCILEARWAQNI